MLRRTSKWLLVCALIISIGGHWALLQSVAWMGMIASYSKHKTFEEAVSNTFDGKHPCALCKAIEKGKADEKKHAKHNFKTDSKLELGLGCDLESFDWAPNHGRVPAQDSFLISRSDTPPKPPPRSLESDSLA